MSKKLENQTTKQEGRRERRSEQRRRELERQQAEKRKRNITIGVSVAAILVVLIGGVLLIQYINGGIGSTSLSATGTPVNTQLHPPVNNISCNETEQLNYHVHAHLAVYIDGQAVQIPAQIGIPSDSTCYYWIHTHTADGFLHIEAPKEGTYTLGTFVDLWSQQFPMLQFPVQLDQTQGWKVWVNGQPYNGDFRNINLAAHTVVTMAYNTPTGVTPLTPSQISWNGL